MYSNSGLNPSIPNIKSTYFPDGLHPNEKGHERIASIMCDYLENIYVGQKNDVEVDINKTDVSMQYGNRFVSSFTEHNRASSTLNIYLEEGQTVRLIDNVKYKWALAGAENQTSNIKTHGYYPESGWSSIASYTILKSGYYGILLMTTDGSEFDFESFPVNTSEFVSTFITLNFPDIAFLDLTTAILVSFGRYPIWLTLTSEVSVETITSVTFELSISSSLTLSKKTECPGIFSFEPFGRPRLYTSLGV